MTTPLVSVIVRSFNRVTSLCKLLDALLEQTWTDLEIVVVEQSTNVPAETLSRLNELALDPRVVLMRRPPLGGAAARNVAVERSRGQVLLFIDDDDLPTDAHWVANHLRALEDLQCLGASGRHVFNDDLSHRVSPLWASLTRTLSFDPVLKLSLTYVQHNQRKIPVQALHGTNASLRRAAWERFGGWDEDTAIEDEVSFCYRAMRGMRPGEYFAYDPRPTILRNRDVSGGLDKRLMSSGVFFGHYLNFVHRIIGRYYPARVVLLYPLYVLVSYVVVVCTLWQDSRRYHTWFRRIQAAVVLLLELPVQVALGLIRLWRKPGAGPKTRPQPSAHAEAGTATAVGLVAATATLSPTAAEARIVPPSPHVQVASAPERAKWLDRTTGT